MDYVKREDQTVIDEENYKIYLENLQKSHQIETEYQHTPISMEQLHQAMQSSFGVSTVVHNFQLPLSPRQMSTLMLKTNHITRNFNFNEIPAHLTRNLTSDVELVQNLTHDVQNLRPEDIILSQNLNRNLDLTLARNLSNDLDQNLIQNISEQDLTRSLNGDLNRIMEAIPQSLRNELPHNMNHELNLTQHLNRPNIDQEIMSQNGRRTPILVQMQDNHILEQNLSAQNLGQRIEHRLVNSQLNLHENQRIEQNGQQLLPMQFNIKSEQDDEYFYDNINQGIGNVNGINGSIPMHQETTQQLNIHQENQTYVYNNHNINAIPALNPIDLYSRPQNYIYQRENPQNLVIHRQVENSPFTEEFNKKFRQDVGQNGAKNVSKEQPKENLKPTDQNKILYAEYQNQIYQQQNLDKDDSNTSDNKLSGDGMTLIKGEYACYKCNDVFPTKRGLKQHAKVCSENGENTDMTEKLGKFVCSQCSYRCQSPAILKIHERTHTGEKPFSCTFCDYKSGQKNNVMKHILVHMKEKPFRCQYCDYRCAQKNNLVVHERTHTGYKPFACPHCDYRTVQKPNLVKHMYLHTNQKPFSCDMCSYRCVQKTNLTKHKQRHLNERDSDKVEVRTQIRPYKPRQKSVKCPHCPYRCVQKSSLLKHMQYKHNEVVFESVNDTIQNLSVGDTIQNFSANDTIQNLSANDAIQNLSANDAIQNLSTSDNIQNLSVSDTIQNLSVKKDQFTECSEKELQQTQS